MNAFIKYNFLPEQFYKAIKEEIDAVDLSSLKGGRSSLDLREDQITTPALMDFNWNFTNNSNWWEKCLYYLGTEIKQSEFKPNFIEPPNGLFQTDEKFLYGRMDVGYGIEGYGVVNGGKGNHIDNFNRIISCLLYFSDQSDMEGGEFEITNAKGETLQRINIRENLLIASVQDKDGWHRVNPVRSVKSPRKAIYFALSYSQKYWER